MQRHLSLVFSEISKNGTRIISCVYIFENRCCIYLQFDLQFGCRIEQKIYSKGISGEEIIRPQSWSSINCLRNLSSKNVTNKKTVSPK